LYLCKDLYKAYPQIFRIVSEKSYLIDFQYFTIIGTVSAELGSDKIQTDMNQLLTNLSFSHFIECQLHDYEKSSIFLISQLTAWLILNKYTTTFCSCIKINLINGCSYTNFSSMDLCTNGCCNIPIGLVSLRQTTSVLMVNEDVDKDEEFDSSFYPLLYEK